MCHLQADQVSFLRTLQSDELWNFYYGRPISIYIIDPETGDLQVANLGPREENHFDFHVPRGIFYYRAFLTATFYLTSKALEGFANSAVEGG